MKKLWPRSRSRSSSQGRMRRVKSHDDLYLQTKQELEQLRDETRLRPAANATETYPPNAPAYTPRIGLELDEERDYVMVLFHEGVRAEVKCSSRGPIKLKVYGEEKVNIPLRVRVEVMNRAEERWETGQRGRWNG